MSGPAVAAALRWYEDKPKLNLVPHLEADDPQGSSQLPQPEAEIEDTIAEHSVNFKTQDRSDQNSHVIVRIEKRVHGGPDRATQSFLGKVIKTPSAAHNVDSKDRAKIYLGQFLLVKVIDAEFFQVDPEYAYMVTPASQRADERFVEEASALRHLHGKEFTGFPHIIPRFYGTWVHETGEGNSKRDIRVILTEYIWGHSIEFLSNYQRREGCLIPLAGEQDLPTAHDKSEPLVVDERTRLRILKHLLDDYVELLRTGVKRTGLQARQIMITLNDDDGNKLPQPRPMLLRHKLTRVSSATVWARMQEWSAENPCAKFDKPLHPFEICTWDFISDLVGWLPEEWRRRENAFMYEGWLLLEFGRIGEDGEDSSVQEYSTLATKDLIMKCTGMSDSYREKRLKAATVYCRKLEKQARLYRDELEKHANQPPEQSTGSKRSADSPPATRRASKRLRPQSVISDPASSNSDEGSRRSDSDHSEYRPPSTKQPAKSGQPQAFDEKYDLIYGGCPEELEKSTGDPSKDQLAAPSADQPMVGDDMTDIVHHQMMAP
ncbi:hypothetical protein CkaCkLH20_10544 [Colletotrichum karsti]|uniref:Uncharacterized protein n=1 Tax=Colletotrichum karsti TaxID=1095194 RepID=A0A9P6HXK9_9PEZI|nr:uncharacterized protein CkaCkLH20_10544 [Colletotrichum karsti]KAF9871912.1 hypothetical protein CkaCkLH20_10544 [Colletotrichum karsti]